MARRAKSGTADKAKVADEVASIEGLIADLEKRLHKLNGAVRDEAVGATSDVSDFVSEALSGIMERVRESSENLTEDVADRAAKAGTDAFKRISHQAEQHPLILLAVAAGIGFLLGMARR